jgi:hypothetical protein
METLEEKKSYYEGYTYEQLLDKVVALSDANHELIEKCQRLMIRLGVYK